MIMEKQVISSGLTRADSQKIRSLSTKKGRDQYGQYLAEGVRLLEEAYNFNVRPQKIVFARAVISDRGFKLIDKFRAKKIPIIEISARLLNSLSDTENNQGLLGLINIPSVKIDHKALISRRRVLLLDNISDPGNTGTLLRSALAFGFDAVFFLKNSVDPFNPKVVRSSVGAIFGLLIAVGSVDDAKQLVNISGKSLIISDLTGKNIKYLFSRKKFSKGLILAVGSEATGLSPILKKLAHFKIHINHDKKVESLNAAVAGSIIMSEIYNQLARRHQ